MPIAKTTPRLRFSKFSDEWQEKKLGEIATFSKGKGIGKLDIVKNGTYKCIRYGELYTDYSEIILNIKSYTDLKKEELVFSKFNDVIMPSSGETSFDIATASCVLLDNVALGGDLNILRGKYSGIFLTYYLNHAKKIDIAKLSQGISVVHIYASHLKGLKISLPSLPEQEKIANFLSVVDEKIEALREKKQGFENYKKGVMQKIFNQTLRFTDEAGNPYPNWQDKRLGEVFTLTRGNVLATANVRKEKNLEYKFPVYSSQTKQKGLLGYYNDYLFEDSLTWTTDGANAGEVNFRKGKFYCTNVCGVMINKKGYCNYCVAEMLNGVTKKYVSYVGNPKLMNNVIAKITIPLPSLPEQKKIADFLSALDEKIDGITAQITQAENFKKFLMQKMFV